MTSVPPNGEALDELYWRAEILQALFWMQGEGLASEVEPRALAEFLQADPETMADQMRRLEAAGYLKAMGTAYRLSPLGVSEGGRSFRDEFEGYIRNAHGECGSDCWCKDPERAGEPCPNAPSPQPEAGVGRR